MDYYAPDYKLHVPVSNMENDNTPSSLEKTKSCILESLSRIEHAPSVQLQTGQPGTHARHVGRATPAGATADSWSVLGQQAPGCHP